MLDRGAHSRHPFADCSIMSLGYDWQRIGDPSLKPKFPLKIYLPQCVEDIVRAVKEVRSMGQTLRVRGNAHSSNDLVLQEGGSILCTGLFDNILHVDTANRTVIVQSGATLAKIDEHLRPHGFGLPVVADHADITAGGIASVGGMSPASHRFGLFVDNVRAVEIVDWDGERHTFRREIDLSRLNRILGGTGRHGVIATLTLDIVPGDKWVTITRNNRKLVRTLDKFLTLSQKRLEMPGEALLQRAVWVEYPTAVRILRIGQCSAYSATAPSALTRWRERLTFACLHFFGSAAGRLPRGLGRVANLLGSIAFVLSPRYASIKNVETFTERAIDISVGEPVRWLAVISPLSAYQDVFRELHRISAHYRDKVGCVSMIAIYVIGLHSDWLANGTGEHHCDLLLHLAVRPEKMTSECLNQLVGEIDAVCIRFGAFRYQYSMTSKSPDVFQRVNANERYCQGTAT